jgi:membrane protease YdiL (CAAX protease family)
LFRSVRDRHGFWIGAIVSGLLFGAAHYIPAAWQDTVLLQSIMVFTGVALAWIYERRGNLVANVAAHMAFNAVGVALILWSR